MAISTVANNKDLLVGRNKNLTGPVKLSSSQHYDPLESDCSRSDRSDTEDDEIAMRLPSIDQRKPLAKDAKDSMTDSHSYQQQQQQQSVLSSTSSSFSSSNHISTELDFSSSQQARHLKKSFEASLSAGSQGQGNQGIQAARQRFLLDKAAKLQGAKAPSGAPQLATQASETSAKSSSPAQNRSHTLKSSSSMSSASQILTHQKAAPQHVVLDPYQWSDKNPTPFTIITNGVYNQSSSHGRPNSAFKHPLSQLRNDAIHVSSATTGHSHKAQNDWATREYLFIKVYNLPEDTTTHDLWEAFRHEGHVAHIRLHENAKGYRDGKASVKFSPPPAKPFWKCGGYSIQLGGVRTVYVGVYAENHPRSRLPVLSKSKYPETMTIYAESVDFGIMFDQNNMMNMHQVLPLGEIGIKFCMNMFHKEILVEFPMHIADPRATSGGPKTQRGKYDRTELFQFRIPFTQLKVIHRTADQGQNLILLISLETPPKFFKQLDPSKSHDDKAAIWGDNDAWYRQTDLVYVPNGLKKSSLAWKKINPIIDLGLWTTYRLVFNTPKPILEQFNHMRGALRDHNIEIVSVPRFCIIPRRDTPVWKLIDLPMKKRSNTGTGLEEMMNANKPRMAFEVRYQLEVCFSQGFLNEHNLSEIFIRTLISMDTKQAQDLLEYIANHGTRVYNPMLLVQAMSWQASLSRTKIPSYCAYVRSATVTPTTVHFHTPVAETSNRMIRQYSQYADRFLRVRFTEEKTEGKIYPTHKDTMNEVFTRVKRVLSNGIRVGDRTYEFLACGNSQFREHGAYFFAPLPNLTTEKIRQWMGMFREIKTVALYASRLGQCFSTTRAIHGAQATMVEIPDIKRNGYNFTDGVGRISPFLAHLAASELGILQPSREPPSVFQIRVGGCKGVLAVCPDSVGRQVHIRKSQYKFPAMHEGLEIIRWSQYAFANLNRQLILILSALGVPDQVFARKLQMQLSRLEQAMTDENMALAILQKEIDHNQMTLTVASMILDGFQKVGEPFLTSLLQLWRAWSIKYLKEKARITIGAGALLLGCVDETATLRGHFNDTPRPPADASNDEKAKCIPQVFVQISNNSEGKSEVMLGPMLLARNPSLHPGDVRVVCGVDVPQLHHLKDVVVLPQTGDRDVAGMCSGGDLDGDDFLVIWDQDLLPSEWNHEPMDYSRPAMEQPNENIGIDDLTTFFVTYMKNDTLPAIAQAHTANADYLEEGVREAKCLKLANLHSMAVDYVKTGQPAHLSRDLKPPKWPHFMEKVGKQLHQIYTSKKVLGQLYDQVERIDFVPAFTAPFDTRILQAYTLDANIIQSAFEIKEEYDAHMRRIMAQQEIKTEFEVWSTFVLQHSSTNNSFKYHEQIGEISIALKDQFRLVCYERAGGKDYEHIGPFAAAMYEVTAREVTAAVEECHRIQMIGGQLKPLREMTPSAMPLMSFPWLFQDVLGKIAKSNRSETVDTLSTREEIDLKASVQQDVINGLQPKRVRIGPGTLDANDYLKTSKGTTRPGEILELFGDSTKASERKGHTEADYTPSTSISVKSFNSSMRTSIERGSSAIDGLVENSSSSSPELLARKSQETRSHDVKVPGKRKSMSTSSSGSHLYGSGSPLHGQERTEVAGIAEKEKLTSSAEAICEQFPSNDSALGAKSKHHIPEGSNLRLLSDLMGGPYNRSDEPGVLNSCHTEGTSAPEEVSLTEDKAAKTSRLFKTNIRYQEETSAEKETVIEEDEKNHNIDEEDGSFSGNEADTADNVVLHIGSKARLLDQLVAIAGGCTSEARER